MSELASAFAGISAISVSSSGSSSSHAVAGAPGLPAALTSAATPVSFVGASVTHDGLRGNAIFSSTSSSSSSSSPLDLAANPSSSSIGVGCWDALMEKELQSMHDVFKRVAGVFHAERTALQEQRIRVEQQKARDSEIEKRITKTALDDKVVLDVGGQYFPTTIRTLTAEPGSMLEAMFSGRFPVSKEDDNAVFLDRDPTYFHIILNYLRDKARGRLPDFCDLHTLSARERLRVLREVSFYGLEGLKQILEHPTLVVSQDQPTLQRLNEELGIALGQEGGGSALSVGSAGNDGGGGEEDVWEPAAKRRKIYFSSIKEALQSAQKGSRIVVLPGVYEESLILDKSVTICGHGNVENVIIQSRDNVVVSSASDGVLCNLTLRQLGGKFNGILVYEGRLTVERCDVSSAGLGCFAVRSAYANLRHNNIHDSPQGGLVFCEGAEGIVEHNRIYGNGLQGIEIREASKPLIRNNFIYNSDQNGVLIHSRGRGEIVENDISNNRIDGIMIISEANPSFIGNNRIHHNRQRGIFLSRDSNGNGVDAEKNDLHGNAIDFMREQ